MTQANFFKALLACSVQIGSVFFAQSALAQYTSEVGVGLGALSYKGELSPGYQFKNNRPALTAFYRKDISVPVTLRGGFTAGFLRADDGNVRGLNNQTPPLQVYRRANMKGSLYEVSAVLEYNFFDYHYRKAKIHFTPYVFVGVAGFLANRTTKTEKTDNAALLSLNKKGSMVGLAVPAGIGFKYALSTHWNLGLEVGARKVFSDRLDHIDGKTGNQNDLVGNPADQDWYFHTGLSISYTFYKINCPPQYKDNPKLLR
jgi:opacity protein-like surface antigen